MKAAVVDQNRDSKQARSYSFLAWLLVASMSLIQTTREIGPITELKPNKVESFLIEETVLKEAKFSFRVPSHEQEGPYYLVVNFNQFRVFKSNPDLPVLKIEGVANGKEYSYFSTESPDWTFDEPLLVVPLLNFEFYRIQFQWREHGFHTSFKSLIGVFTGTSLKTVMGFMLPVIIPVDKAFAQVTLEYPLGNEIVTETLVQVRICQGSVSSITLGHPVEGSIGELVKSQQNPQVYYLTMQNVHPGSTFDLKLVAAAGEVSDLVIAKVQFLPLWQHSESSSGSNPNGFLKELLEHKQPARLLPLGSGSTQISWTNLGFEARQRGYSVKTLFNFGINKADVEFKSRCGFCKLVLTRKFPSVEGVESATLLNEKITAASAASYEYAYFAEPLSAEDKFSVDLWVERTYRFSDGNRQIMLGTHFVTIKEIYYSDSNYKDASFLMNTVVSDLLSPPVVSNSKGEGFARFHGFTVMISLTFFGALSGLLCLLNVKYRRKSPPTTDNHMMVSETDPITDSSTAKTNEGEAVATFSTVAHAHKPEFEPTVEDADDEGATGDI